LASKKSILFMFILYVHWFIIHQGNEIEHKKTPHPIG